MGAGGGEGKEGKGRYRMDQPPTPTPHALTSFDLKNVYVKREAVGRVDKKEK